MTENTRAAVLAELENCLNIPYIYGGNNPLQGLDCSGFACWVLKRFGLIGYREDLSASQLLQRFTTPAKRQDFGALIFFGHADKISHVGFSLGADRFIEAGGGDNACRTVENAAARDAMVRRNMHAFRQDFNCATMPPWPELNG